jgi:hypothetical protein
MGFQKTVNTRYAPAQAGDFASSNPRASLLAGPNSLVAGVGGVVIGCFAWAAAGSADIESGETDFYNTVTNAGSGVPTGFVHREQQGLITTFLAEAGVTIQVGSMVTLHVAGDFWVKTATTATVGQKIFASNTDGSVKTAAAGATVTGYTETKWFVMSAGAANDLIKMSSYAIG